MELEIQPKSLRPAYVWRRFANEPTVTLDRFEYSVFYIGKDDESPFLYDSIFSTGMHIDNLNDAQQVIKDLPRSQFPDVIILDVQFDKKALRYFQNFLSERKFLSKIIVIYNDSKLSSANINYLKTNELIDDIINVSTSREILLRKIHFLKKIKTSLPRFKADSLQTQVNSRLLPATNTKPMILKRIIDIVFSCIILLISFPVLILIAVAIRLDSPGPVIYNSLRAGRGFRIFKFYKFRTMVNGADKRMEEFAHLNQYNESTEGDAKFVKIANDPRVTRIGKFLRNTSLDELPQLINVFKGDMSLVGNRPLPLYEASTLTTNQHVERFMAPAGITGLWQIKKRGKSDMSVEERVNLDICYARRNNVFYDLWIVANTPAALFQKSNV